MFIMLHHVTVNCYHVTVNIDHITVNVYHVTVNVYHITGICLREVMRIRLIFKEENFKTWLR
jgi:hypothetical protein